MPLELLAPDWDAPTNIRALTSTRLGGTSLGAFASLNLGDHVGDDPARVAANRALLRDALRLPNEPSWLEQSHGCDVADADGVFATRPRADAAVARRPGRVCV
ncbi:MAG: laccase domain-containing protein, partial [Thiohalocapsa sp.]